MSIQKLNSKVYYLISKFHLSIYIADAERIKYLMGIK